MTLYVYLAIMAIILLFLLYLLVGCVRQILAHVRIRDPRKIYVKRTNRHATKNINHQ